MALQIAILGSVEPRLNGQVVGVPAGKQRALLTWLAIRAPQPVSAEAAAEALWPRAAPAEALRSLQVTVSRLRRSLGAAGSVLETVTSGYRLAVEADAIDARRFETLVDEARAARVGGDGAAARRLLDEALGLWRGPALADVGFESFAQAEIARLQELRLAALEERIDVRLAEGEHALVVAELEQLSAEHPSRERLVGLLMLALYRCGRQSDALEVYTCGRLRLDEELGLDPSPELQRLQQAILRHDPSLATSRPSRRPAPPAAPPTPTVGRERDLAALAAALSENRLVTLTGPGGVGKTRLAIEAARALADRYPAGVYVAWLAPVAHAGDMPAALAAAVDVASQPGEHPQDALVRRLGGAGTLLVADNLEHVLEAAPLLADLLAACPQLGILGTSREPLRLRGERCVPVDPLAVPDGTKLFVDRARDRRPDFRLTDANGAAVAELCRRLDGLPLALELAAGRIGLLEPEQIVARLADALSVLEGGSRDAPARQQTVRATLEWSVELLDEPEHRAFLALGAFTGGSELEAAEQVTGAPLAVLDALVAKSLVRLRDGRLAMLEVVRQFAAAGLADSPEGDAVRDRHAAWFLDLAERLGAEVRVRGAGAALHRVDRELGNLRAALEWRLARGDGELSLRIAAALEPYWFERNQRREGIHALDRALALADSGGDRARGRAHRARCRLAMWEDPGWGPAARAEDARVALALARAAGDIEGECMALDALAEQATIDADFARAGALAREQRAVAEQLGDAYHVAMAVARQAWAEPGLVEARGFAAEAALLLRRCGSLHEIARMQLAVVMVALTEEDYEAAEELAVEGLRVADEAGNPFWVMASLGVAGLAALFLERIDVAEQRFREQLAICRRERFEGLEGEALLGLAAVAARAGNSERAAMLTGASELSMQRVANEADRPVYERLHARFIAPARLALGESAWARGDVAGHALALEEVYDLALVDERVGSGAAVGPRRR
jgi:predicted ATPase/DNA-binding SARP family transcriptional activator